MKALTTALVTGASGFVGRHLLDHLSSSTDWDLIGLNSRSRSSTDDVRMLACDLRDADLTKRTLTRYRPDIIFHLAGQAYVPQSIAQPVDTLISNVVSQLNLFEACKQADIAPIIVVVSSSEVYGQISPNELPIVEDQQFRPANPYAVSKAAQDLYAYQYATSTNLPIICVRPFNHIGPGQSDRFVLSSFARQVAEAEAGIVEPVILVGNLEAERDFLDVRDVVRAYAAVASAEFRGSVFNVASGKPVRVERLLELLIHASGTDISVEQDPSRMRPSDVPVSYGNSGRLHDATGWEPMIELETSVIHTLDYWRERVKRSRG